MRNLVSRACRALLLPAVGLVAVGAACVDPKGDFDEYVQRTNDVRGMSPDTGVADVPVFETEDTANSEISGTYFASCLPELVKDSPHQSLLFYIEFIQSGDAFDFTVRPLLETATTFSRAQTVGTPQVKTGVVVTNGMWAVDIGKAEIPGDSQRIGASLLKLEDIKYNGRVLSKDRMCTTIDGRAVEPIMIAFDAAPCVMVRLKDGDPLPKANDGAGLEWAGFSKADHHCP